MQENKLKFADKYKLLMMEQDNRDKKLKDSKD